MALGKGCDGDEQTRDRPRCSGGHVGARDHVGFRRPPSVFLLGAERPFDRADGHPGGDYYLSAMDRPFGCLRPPLYGPTCLFPINGGCTGVYGVNGLTILGAGSLALTAFTPNTSSPVFTSGGLYVPCVGRGCELPPSYLDQFPKAIHITSTGADTLGTIGNSTPFDVGSLSITNDGSGAGAITLANPTPPFAGSPTYLDANEISTFPVTVPQTLAVAVPVPEPGTVLLLGVGLAGLAVAVGARRSRMK